MLGFDESLKWVTGPENDTGLLKKQCVNLSLTKCWECALKYRWKSVRLDSNN